MSPVFTFTSYAKQAMEGKYYFGRLSRRRFAVRAWDVVILTSPSPDSNLCRIVALIDHRIVDVLSALVSRRSYIG